jgi:hypothetical protein
MNKNKMHKNIPNMKLKGKYPKGRGLGKTETDGQTLLLGEPHKWKSISA